MSNERTRARRGLALLTAAALLSPSPALGATGALAQGPATGLPVRSEGQDRLLAGRAHGLRFVVFGPGRLILVGTQPDDALYLSAPPPATMIAVRWDDPTIKMAFRLSSSVDEVYAFRHRQLVDQGFQRLSLARRGRTLNAVYARGEQRVGVRIERQTGIVFSTAIDLLGAPGGAAVPTRPVERPTAATSADGGVVHEGEIDRTLGYTVYGVEPPGVVPRDERRIQLYLPPGGARIGDLQAQGEDVRFLLRTPLAPSEILGFYRGQLADQGFRQVRAGAATPDAASATFERGATRLEWSARRESEGAYRLVFDFRSGG